MGLFDGYSEEERNAMNDIAFERLAEKVEAEGGVIHRETCDKVFLDDAITIESFAYENGVVTAIDTEKNSYVLAEGEGNEVRKLFETFKNASEFFGWTESGIPPFTGAYSPNMDAFNQVFELFLRSSGGIVHRNNVLEFETLFATERPDEVGIKVIHANKQEAKLPNFYAISVQFDLADGTQYMKYIAGSPDIEAAKLAAELMFRGLETLEEEVQMHESFLEGQFGGLPN